MKKFQSKQQHTQQLFVTELIYVFEQIKSLRQSLIHKEAVIHSCVSFQRLRPPGVIFEGEYIIGAVTFKKSKHSITEMTLS